MSWAFMIPIEEMIEAVGSMLDIEKNKFYSLTRKQRRAWGRAVVAYLGRNLVKYRAKEMADHSDGDSVLISQAVKRVEQKLREDEVFVKLVETLQQNLIRGKRHKYLIT